MTKEKSKKAPRPRWRSWKPNPREDRELKKLLEKLRQELQTTD